MGLNLSLSVIAWTPRGGTTTLDQSRRGAVVPSAAGRLDPTVRVWSSELADAPVERVEQVDDPRWEPSVWLLHGLAAGGADLSAELLTAVSTYNCVWSDTVYNLDVRRHPETAFLNG